MSDTIDNNQPNALPPPERRRRVSARRLGIGGAIAVLIAGAALGAGGTRLAQNWEPQRVMLLQPAAISDMREDTSSPSRARSPTSSATSSSSRTAPAARWSIPARAAKTASVVTKGEASPSRAASIAASSARKLIAHADGPQRGVRTARPQRRTQGGTERAEGTRRMARRADRDGPPPPPRRPRRSRTAAATCGSRRPGRRSTSAAAPALMATTHRTNF